MREIEFRGKRTGDGVWTFGFLVKYPESVLYGDDSPYFIRMPPADPDDAGSSYNVDPATVGQYTGMKDKNGVKIFEGDILAIDTDDDGDNGERFTVYLDDYEWTAKSRRFEYPFGILRDECEVVGNIYDNPELMEVQE